MSDFPNSPRPASIDWRLAANTQIFASPLDGTVQTTEHPGARWIATLIFQDLKRSEIASLEAFIISLRGAAGRFQLWNMAREAPQGNAAGAPYYETVDSTASSLKIQGWTALAEYVLLAGDFIEVGGELKMVTANVFSDGAGNSQVPISPPMRTMPTQGALVTTSKPKATFRLADDNQANFKYRRALGAFTITCVEAFV